MRTVVFQSAFNSGEIDPVLYDRSDLNQTGRAARTLSNWRILPQGGIVKRDGTQYLTTISNTPDDCRILSWVYTTDEAYIVVMTSGVVRIFDLSSKTFVASISNTIWVGPEELKQFRYRQVLDTMFLTQYWAAPQKLVKLGGYSSNPFATTSGSSLVTVHRVNHNLSAGDLVVFSASATGGGVTISSSTTYSVTSVVDDNYFRITAASNATSTTTFGGTSVSSWCLATIKLINIPKIDFSDNLSPSVTSNTIQRITFLEDWFPCATTSDVTNEVVATNSGSQFKLSFNGTTSNWFYWMEMISPVGNPNWFQIISQMNLGLKAVVGQDFSIKTPVQNTSAGDLGVGIDSGGNPYLLIEFTGKYAGKDVSLMTATVGGKSPQPMMSVTIDTPANVSLEDVWSTTRGWPRSVEYFEGRLCFGGSNSQPSTFWTSVTSDFSNFDLGDAHDDEGISRDVDVNAADAIEHLVAGRHLMVMSRRGEYYQTETPMTPENATFKQQTAHGSSDVAPCKVGGSVYFVQRNGGGVRRLLYNYQEDAFAADEVTVLARHLFDSSHEAPVAIAAHAHPKDGDYLFVVQSGGRMAVLSVDKSQEVAGWWQWRTTQGSVKDIAVVNDDVYLVVDRYQTSTEGKICLEKITSGGVLDSYYSTSLSSPSTITISGLAWLDKSGALAASGVIARIDFADGGEPLIDHTPAIASGVYTKVLTTDQAARGANKITIGYKMAASFTPLPIPFDVGTGNMMVRRKRVSRLTLDCASAEVGSSGLSIGTAYARQQAVFAEKTGSAKSWVIDGQVTVPILGWSRMPTVSDTLQTVTHDYPGTCTIKSIEREVEATGHLGEEK